MWSITIIIVLIIESIVGIKLYNINKKMKCWYPEFDTTNLFNEYMLNNDFQKVNELFCSGKKIKQEQFELLSSVVGGTKEDFATAATYQFSKYQNGKCLLFRMGFNQKTKKYEILNVFPVSKDMGKFFGMDELQKNKIKP